jgi:hypothetical protein
VADGTVNRIGSLIRQLQGALAGKAFRSGTGTLTWPGASGFTNTVTIAHGLDTTPTGATATASLLPGSPPCIVHYVSMDATNVQWRGYCPDSTPAAATTKTFTWTVNG